jgi:hypothetical protein
VPPVADNKGGSIVFHDARFVMAVVVVGVVDDDGIANFNLDDSGLLWDRTGGGRFMEDSFQEAGFGVG